MAQHSVTFTATSTSSDIDFEGGGTRDSLGSMLDNVRPECVNLPPVAQNDPNFVFPNNGGSYSSETSVLANDTDEDNLPLTAELVDGPADGTLSFSTDGTFVYTPSTSNSRGQVTFTYRASDGCDFSKAATVTVDVTQPDSGGFNTGGGRLEGVKRTFGFVAKVAGGQPRVPRP